MFLGTNLRRRYWTNFSDWKSEWLLDSVSNKIRYLLAQQLGLDRIFSDLANIATPFHLNLHRCLKAESLTGISKLKNLTGLTISGNSLTTISDEIQELAKLKYLDIGTNNLSLLSDSICKLEKLEKLYSEYNNLTKVSVSQLGNLINLEILWLKCNQISELPENFGNLVKLKDIDLSYNCLTELPDSIGQCQNITELNLSRNQIIELPDSIGRCQKVLALNLNENKLTELPETLGNLVNLHTLLLEGNQIHRLPASMSNLVSLMYLRLHLNPIDDLSVLQNLPALQSVQIFGVYLPRRYWMKFSEWKAEWLLDETNAEIRRRLIELIGYEKICDELGAIAIDSWQEYTLLKIDNIQIIYQGWREVGREPMMLLKMTCPSTAHVHILRVPPDMTSAEAAIVWVNHGIHPSQFSVQT